MMGQYSFKKLLFILMFLKIGFSSHCQSLALRFSYGGNSGKTVWSKIVNKDNLDPSFNGNLKGKIYTAIFGAELIYPKGSYEIGFTNQDFIFGTKTNFDAAGLGYLNKDIYYFRQLQFCYNRIFPIKIQKKDFNIKPIFSIGFSLGFNSNFFQYDDTNLRNNLTYNSLINPNDYLSLNPTDKPISRIAFGGILKIGFGYQVKNIERARFQFSYNPGFNKIAERNYLYFHNNSKFTGKAVSFGSQSSMTLSIPIYLKRKK